MDNFLIDFNRFFSESTKDNIQPTQIIQNGHTTIILWNDGTKTIAQKDNEDEHNPELGIIYALLKKVCGNSTNAIELMNNINNQTSKKENK